MVRVVMVRVVMVRVMKVKIIRRGPVCFMKNMGSYPYTSGILSLARNAFVRVIV
jgi:hypothetical protein